MPKLPRLPLAALAIAAALGIWSADVLGPDPRWLATAALALLAAAVARAGTVVLCAAAACAFGAAHAWQWAENPSRAWARDVAPSPRAVEVTGVLLEEPTAAPGGAWRARAMVEEWRFGEKTADLRGEAIVRWNGNETPRYGDRWKFHGTLSRPDPPRSPGQFDASRWLERRGIFLALRADQAALLSRGHGSPLQAWAFGARAWMLRTLALGLEDAPDARSLVAGVAIGARDAESDHLDDAFRQTGTVHLFSVSGLHVGMFALLLWLVLRPFGLSRRAAVAAIVPLIFFYALVTGASPPAIRSAVMISIAFGGLLLDRSGSPANALAAAALLLLAWDTNQLFSAGFQLSFCVVAAIFFLAPALQAQLGPMLQPDPFLPRKLYTRRQRWASRWGRELAAALGVSGAAWLGGLPLTAAMFHLVPVLAVPANLLAVPLAFAILSVSVLSLISGAASAWAATVFNNANWGLAKLMLACVQGVAALPGAYVYLPPGWAQPPARLVVYDLGDGGAQLLRTRQDAWLFDAGSEQDFARIIEPSLREFGVGRLGVLALTHGDSGHSGGARAALDMLSPERVVETTLRDRSPARRRAHEQLRAAARPKCLVFPGDEFRAGAGTRVRILYPGPSDAGRTADDQALVALVETQGFRVLLMSDSGLTTEAALLEKARGDLRCDVLVYGRHGEDMFASDDFLRAARPRVIVLSRGDPFRAGTGEPALRERLAASGATVLDQAACGAVTFTFRPGEAEAHGFLGGSAIVLRPR